MNFIFAFLGVLAAALALKRHTLPVADEALLMCLEARNLLPYFLALGTVPISKGSKPDKLGCLLCRRAWGSNL